MKRLMRLLAILALAVFPASAASAAIAPQKVVDSAYYVLRQVEDHSQSGESLRTSLRTARAVLIIPQMLKGAFFIGGEGGQGVLLARAPDGSWTYPAFFNAGAASIGLQFGVQTSDLVLVVRTGRGLKALLEKRVRLGADISAAVGGEGQGLEAATTAGVGPDIVAYSVNRGAFIGASVEGAAIWPATSFNTEYYKSAEATPDTIILKGQYSNPRADRLRTLLGTIPKDW